MNWMLAEPWRQFSDDSIPEWTYGDVELGLMLTGMVIRDITRIQFSQQDPEDDGGAMPSYMQASRMKFTHISEYWIPVAQGILTLLNSVVLKKGKKAATAPPRTWQHMVNPQAKTLRRIPEDDSDNGSAEPSPAKGSSSQRRKHLVGLMRFVQIIVQQQ